MGLDPLNKRPGTDLWGVPSANKPPVDLDQKKILKRLFVKFKVIYYFNVNNYTFSFLNAYNL